MRIEVCQDKELIKECLTNPFVRKGIVEAGYENIEYTEPSHDICFSFFDDEEFLGIALTRILTSLVVELHTCLLPAAKGKSTQAFELYKRWFFDNTDIDKIITMVPTSNPLAKRAAINAGFVKTGEIKNGFYSSDAGVVDLDIYENEL